MQAFVAQSTEASVFGNPQTNDHVFVPALPTQTTHKTATHRAPLPSRSLGMQELEQSLLPASYRDSNSTYNRSALVNQQPPPALGSNRPGECDFGMHRPDYPPFVDAGSFIDKSAHQAMQCREGAHAQLQVPVPEMAHQETASRLHSTPGIMDYSDSMGQEDAKVDPILTVENMMRFFSLRQVARQGGRDM
ncbi:hypothetical protein ACHAPU_010810 [Fusarium lateritium]